MCIEESLSQIGSHDSRPQVMRVYWHAEKQISADHEARKSVSRAAAGL